jgi:hypothetical protein
VEPRIQFPAAKKPLPLILLIKGILVNENEGRLYHYLWMQLKHFKRTITLATAYINKDNINVKEKKLITK